MGKGRPATEQSVARWRASLRSAARRRKRTPPRSAERRPRRESGAAEAKRTRLSALRPPRLFWRGSKLRPAPAGQDDGVPRAGKNRGDDARLLECFGWIAVFERGRSPSARAAAGGQPWRCLL